MGPSLPPTSMGPTALMTLLPTPSSSQRGSPTLMPSLHPTPVPSFVPTLPPTLSPTRIPQAEVQIGLGVDENFDEEEFTQVLAENIQNTINALYSSAPTPHPTGL